MRIGVDIDGVLAQFNDAYIEKCIEVTGKDLFPPRPFDILTWNYPESFGYSKEEMSVVWGDIKASNWFWLKLKAYPETSNALDTLRIREWRHGDEVYFITARPGVRVKAQTEDWIRSHCFYEEYRTPTVLISSLKGLCAQALKLDAYIDDRKENVWDVVGTGTRTFVMDRPWNQGNFTDIQRVSSIQEMLALLP